MAGCGWAGLGNLGARQGLVQGMAWRGLARNNRGRAGLGAVGLGSARPGRARINLNKMGQNV